MPKSKTDKKRKDKVKSFKKSMSNNKEEVGQVPTGEEQQGLPEVQEVPTWDPRANLDIMGKEFEMIYNGINELSNLFSQGMVAIYGAAQSIMQNNVASGKIDVKFHKLVEVEGKQDYVPMNEEESKPYEKELEEFKTKLLAAKTKIEAEAAVISQERSAEDAGIVLPTDDEVAKMSKRN